jgi:hypothetical protein
VTTKKQPSAKKSPAPDLGRHSRDCSICAHAQRENIEQDFCDWQSPAQIEVKVRAVYRHARATNLFSRRDRNVRAALGVLIEKVSRVRATGSVVVAAIVALSKINNAGRWIDRSETVDLNALFERMSQQELENYATNGVLPAWFERTVRGDTPIPSPLELEA